MRVARNSAVVLIVGVGLVVLSSCSAAPTPVDSAGKNVAPVGTTAPPGTTIGTEPPGTDAPTSATTTTESTTTTVAPTTATAVTTTTALTTTTAAPPTTLRATTTTSQAAAYLYRCTITIQSQTPASVAISVAPQAPLPASAVFQLDVMALGTTGTLGFDRRSATVTSSSPIANLALAPPDPNGPTMGLETITVTEMSHPNAPACQTSVHAYG